MIELIIKNHLESELVEPIFLEKPTKATGSYVVFEKVGSSKKNTLESGTFAFQSYGTSIFEAVELNGRVKQAVESLINLNEIRSVKLNSDYNFTDTSTKEYRYQAVFDIGY